MNKTLKIVFSLAVTAVLIWAGVFYWNNLRGVDSAIGEPPQEVLNEAKQGNIPLDIPDDFSISIWTDGLPDARVLVRDGLGNFWVSQPDMGQVTLLEVNDQGEVANKEPIFTGLRTPHGLAVDHRNNGMTLYIAEEHRISKVDLYTEDSLTKIVDLPAGGRHTTRTIGFGPDDRLYVSIGSSCDTCVEDDRRRAAIYSMRRDGSDFKSHAQGLRNAVFFDWSYVDGRMWATEMGRDHLGDDLPPDEINIVEEGKHYGWPYCYDDPETGEPIRDEDFDSGEQFDCSDTEGAHIELQAHVAPLGLDFVPEEGWPEKYWYDLLVAYHGSWNRSDPVGYKIARLELDENGNFQEEHDFITGWLLENDKSWGRPVDVLATPSGILYITDDKGGMIYKVTYDKTR